MLTPNEQRILDRIHSLEYELAQSRWRWFLSGVVCGALAAAGVWLLLVSM